MAIKKRIRDDIEYSDAKGSAGAMLAGFTAATLKLPKDVSQFVLKEGRFKLDVMPFRTSLENRSSRVPQGKVHWEWTYFAHSGIGADPKELHVCNAQTYGEKCACCDYANKLQREGAEYKLVKKFQPRRRQLICVRDLANKEKGYQVYEGPFFNGLGQKIANKIDAADDDSPFLRFYSLTKGMTLKLTVKKGSWKNADTGEGGVKNEITDMEAIERSVQYDPKVLDKIPVLSDCLKKLTYKKMQELLEQGGIGNDEDEDEDHEDEDHEDEEKDDDSEDEASEDDEEENEESESDEDEDSEDDDPTAEDAGIEVGTKVKYKKGVWKVIHVSGDGTSLRIKKGTVVKKGVAPNECEVIEEEEEEESEEEESDEEPEDIEEEESEDEESEDESEEEDDFDSDDEDSEDEEETTSRKKKKPTRKK